MSQLSQNLLARSDSHELYPGTDALKPPEDIEQSPIPRFFKGIEDFLFESPQWTFKSGEPEGAAEKTDDAEAPDPRKVLEGLESSGMVFVVFKKKANLTSGLKE